MMRRFGAMVAAIAVVLGLTTMPAAAVPAVKVVHTEKVQAGPYTILVGFSVWPIRAQQSLDFTFLPDGGIADKHGTLTRIEPNGDVLESKLSRHPRARDKWGLDIEALRAEGNWTFRFAVDGPQGKGTGELENLAVLKQPGPPMGLSWAIGALPFFLFIAAVVVAWRRTSRAKPVLTS
ncbi:hypothetical protein [Kribbella hippodromi]